MSTIKKIRIAALVSVFLLCSNALPAQQLTLFNIDTTQYPVVKADFFAINGLENQITTLTKEAVFIEENTQTQEVIRVTNPATVKPKQLSLVLTLDISESMEKQYMSLAKRAAESIVTKLPLDISECAVTSFHDVSFVNTDFTRDRFKLLQSIRTLTPSGGTNYNKGFIKSNAGGLDILKNGLHEKVLIFLTDGYGDVNPTEIIQRAKSIGAKVYVITLGMRTPEELKRIVTATNGSYYEDIISEQEINAVYLSILYRSQGLTPSTVEWVSTPACGYAKQLTFGERVHALKPATAQYNAPPASIIRLQAPKNTSTFNASTKKIIVPLKAVNGDVTLTSFNSSNPSFTVTAPAFPRTIKKNATEEFSITYSGSSGEFVSGRIELTSDGCQSTFIYYQYQPPSVKPALNLVAPDGNETFYVGQDTLIRWSLQNTSAPVKISFSSNAGKNWFTVADTTTAAQLRWVIPNKPGTTNLIKVETVAGDQTAKSESKIVYDGFADAMNAYNLSPDGTRYISQTETELFLYDTYTNTVINKMKNTIKNGYFIFSPDGKYLFLYDQEKPVRVYDGHTFEFVEEWGVFKNTLSSYIEPYINNDLSQYVARDTDGSLGIFNFKTGAKIKAAPFIKGKEVTDFTKNYIVTLEEGDHSVWVWDYKKEKRLLEISAPQDRIVNAEFNNDETILLVHTWGSDGARQNFTAYDVTGKQVYIHKNTDKAFMSLDVYENYALCSVEDKPALIDMNTGKVITTYNLSVPVKFGWFIPFSGGKYILLTSASSRKAYMLTSGIADTGGNVSDQSAAVFSILSTKPEVKPILFSNVYVGNNKDSILTSCIKNNTRITVPIKQIVIEGTGAASFKLLNPISAFGIPALSGQDLEVRFAPVKTGRQQATLKIVTLYDTIRVPVSGNGIIKPYSLKTDELNVGLVAVGQIKDTTFTKLLTNTSSGVMYITSMRLGGPDTEQFTVVSAATALPAGASTQVKITFSPVKRGRTSTQLLISIKNAVSVITVPVYAEAYAPREYTIQLNFIDAATRARITAVPTCVDRQANTAVTVTAIDNGNAAQVHAYADRIYVFTIKKEGYKPVYDSINLLQTVNNNATITKVIELFPDGSATYDIAGTVFNKSTHTALVAAVSFYDAANKRLIKKIETGADGSYNTALPAGLYAIQVEKEGYVNEHATLEITAIEQENNIKNFELTPIKVGETISLPNVYFARGGVELLESSNESLDQLYALLYDNPTMRIELLGHTDNQGDARLNVLLSEQRVAAIKEYLVAKGIGEKRITGKGYGGSKPIANNATEESRKLNRRVEFKIISK